jgi:glutathione S-transferase
MPYVAIVTVLALVEFFWFGMMVARARDTFGVHAPATTGNEMFERYFRVHMNTLEQLVVFLPVMWVFAAFVSPIWAAVGGVVFIVGRAVYAIAYIGNPRQRTLGFVLTGLPILLMMIGILIWGVRALVLGAAA